MLKKELLVDIHAALEDGYEDEGTVLLFALYTLKIRLTSETHLHQINHARFSYELTLPNQ